MKENDHTQIDALVGELAELYDRPFGGKVRGRFRVSMKLLCKKLGKRRLWPNEIEAIGRALYQRGYVSIDMEDYLVVLTQKTFTNYRRVNEAAFDNRSDTKSEPPDASDPAQGSA